MVVADSVLLQGVVEHVGLILMRLCLPLLRSAGIPSQVSCIERTLYVLLEREAAAHGLRAAVVLNEAVNVADDRVLLLLVAAQELADAREALARRALVGSSDAVHDVVD